MAIEMSPRTAAFVQVWGFVDGQDPNLDPLMLLSEVAFPIVGDSVTNAAMDPRR